MKKTLLMLCSVAALACASASWARPPHDGPSRERLQETLNLDQRQAEQVSQILQEQRAKRKALREAQRTQMRTSMQTLQQETIERLRPILSPEQLQQFLQLRERRGRHGSRDNDEERAPRERRGRYEPRDDDDDYDDDDEREPLAPRR